MVLAYWSQSLWRIKVGNITGTGMIIRKKMNSISSRFTFSLDLSQFTPCNNNIFEDYFTFFPQYISHHRRLIFFIYLLGPLYVSLTYRLVLEKQSSTHYVVDSAILFICFSQWLRRVPSFIKIRSKQKDRQAAKQTDIILYAFMILECMIIIQFYQRFDKAL